MRKFQICPQNSNTITFDPLLAKKTNWQTGCVEDVEFANCGKLAKLGILPVLTVFDQNGCQMVFCLRFETTFGIRS